MTRTLSRLLVVLILVFLATGPMLGAPLLVSPALQVDATRTAAGPGAALLTLLTTGAIVFGAIRIKDVGSLSKKFVQRAQTAGGDYADGVKNSGGDWEANTKNAEDNYSAGVQQAITDKRFGKGVAAAGAGKWVQKATTLGAQRYPGGVAASEGDWAKGVAPHLQAMASMTLPARRPKGDPQNMQRAQAVAALNRQIKLGK